MAEIYRKPNSPFWYADFYVGGSRRRVSTKRKAKKEAKKAADEMERQALDALQHGGGLQELSLREALWGHYLAKHRQNPRFSEYEHRCKKVCDLVEGITGIPGDTPFHELTTTRLRRYQMDRRADGASEQTIDHEVKCISAAYNLVSEDFRVRQGLRFPMFRPKGRPRPLLPDEETALLVELDPTRPFRGRGGKTYFPRVSAGDCPVILEQRQLNHDLVVGLLDTGCRLSELTNLTWDMVDTVDFEWIHIIRWKVDKSSSKGREGWLRTTKRLSAVLRRRHERGANLPYVFHGWKRTQTGEWLPAPVPASSTQAIRRAMERIGINSPINVKRFGRRDVRSLRDTFATKLRRKGMALEDLQPLLGHSDIKMTTKYADADEMRITSRAVEMLED